MQKQIDLNEMYNMAARRAFGDGIRTEDDLLVWIKDNCTYRPETEFFVYLGISSALFDLIAQAAGYKNEFHRAYAYAKENHHPRP